MPSASSIPATPSSSTARRGEVHIRPAPDLEAAYIERVRLRARRQLQYFALRDKPCVTRDGEDVALLINAGLLVDLPHIVETGAAGIGLFRTELQFMVASQFPRTGEQLALYRAVLDAAAGRPVTFRTLDIGGDKVLPYMRNIEEENPALGWRAIRLGLDRPALLRSQIRALLRAASNRELKLMFPMVATVDEFDQAKELVERELTYLRRHGHKLPERVEVGTMLEVPALLYQLDELLERVDFLSVGSNDLAQFLFAADRGNPRVNTRFDELSIPMLRALKDIADAGCVHDKPVTLCGEMASRTDQRAGADRARIPQAVAGAVRGRSGQGDGDGTRCRQGPRRGKRTDRAQGRRRLDPGGADGLRRGRGHSPLERYRFRLKRIAL